MNGIDTRLKNEETISRDDYGHKFVEYEAMGIAEYWIVDYRALGAIRYIGKPKQPTVTICKLIEGEYQMEKFVKGDRLKSHIFPQLELTTDAIFNSSQYQRLSFRHPKRSPQVSINF